MLPPPPGVITGLYNTQGGRSFRCYACAMEIVLVLWKFILYELIECYYVKKDISALALGDLTYDVDRGLLSMMGENIPNVNAGRQNSYNHCSNRQLKSLIFEPYTRRTLNLA